MNSSTFREQNLLMKGNGADIGDLAVFRSADRSALTSCWRPTPEERAAIAAGDPIWLTVYGGGQPPVCLEACVRPITLLSPANATYLAGVEKFFGPEAVGLAQPIGMRDSLGQVVEVAILHFPDLDDVLPVIRRTFMGLPGFGPSAAAIRIETAKRAYMRIVPLAEGPRWIIAEGSHHEGQPCVPVWIWEASK